MPLASLCKVSGGGENNNYLVGSQYLGNATVASDSSLNTSIRYMTEHDGISWNSQYVLDRPRKTLKYTVAESGHGDKPIARHSVATEWTHGTPKISYESSTLSPQEVGSDGTTQDSKSQQIYCSNNNQMSHGSVQSYLFNDDSFHGQSLSHENLQYSSRPSFQSSPFIRSCLSGGSPMPSQISQMFPNDSQFFHSSEYAFELAESGYSCSEKPSDLKYMLQELETALLGPDSNDPNSYIVLIEEPSVSENSKWSLEGVSSATGTIYQSSQPIYSEPEKAQLSRVKENPQQLMDEEGKSVKPKRMTGGQRTDVHFPKSISEEQKEVQELEIPHGDVRQLLIAGAKAVADSDMVKARKFISALRQVVSIRGEPIQRLGAYMVEGLVARLASSGGKIYQTLKCKVPASAELLSYMHILYEVCPYFKFGYLAANGAIAEAFKHEDSVHIIDFQIAQGSQWVTLIQALAARPGGPPHVRITGIDDPIAEYARGGGLQLVGQRLSKLAETHKVPFEFHAVPIVGHDVQVDMLEVRTGEALAVNFAFQLHHMPDESVNTSNHRDRLLRMAKGMSPKVVTLVEQEANTNTAPFFPRFMEALSYYTAIFESLDLTLPRESKDRINVEQHCLARDMVNIIACEGAERVERHEVLGKWKSRLTMAGFKPYPLSSHVNCTIKSLMESSSENYRIVEKDEALYLGWLDRYLIVASAWK
eukprot:Gb_02264 [translate_table: standard]